jgi:hypothetical protein
MIQPSTQKSAGPPGEAELLERVRAHWRTYRPVTFKRLQNSQSLEEALQTAVNLTLTAMEQLVRQHRLAPWAAWELVREEWALMPAETDPEADPPEPQDDQTLAAASVDDSPAAAGSVWPASLARCLKRLGRWIGRKSRRAAG